MSRLGDLIRLERSRRGLSAKQVARKCGVSESYLLAVEAGTRIIADDQARRILKSMGMQQQTEADFSLDDIAATVDLQSASDTVQRAQATQQRIQKTRPEAEKVAATELSGTISRMEKIFSAEAKDRCSISNCSARVWIGLKNLDMYM